MQPNRKRNKTKSTQTIIGGCGLLVMLILIGIITVFVVLLDREREVARYPGAIQVSRHSNYNALPRAIRWDDSYRTTDPFPKVYNWYSTKFDLGAEARANSGCILLQGSQSARLVERYTGVMICDTPKGRLIFVTRGTTVR